MSLPKNSPSYFQIPIPVRTVPAGQTQPGCAAPGTRVRARHEATLLPALNEPKKNLKLQKKTKQKNIIRN